MKIIAIVLVTWLTASTPAQAAALQVAFSQLGNDRWVGEFLLTYTGEVPQITGFTGSRCRAEPRVR